MVDLQGIRRITDEGGLLWEVWEAHPRLAERRRMRDRRLSERANARDRRVGGPDLRVKPADGDGWLVFRSAFDERRRAPIPAAWESMSAELLLELLRQARATAPFPRRRA